MANWTRKHWKLAGVGIAIVVGFFLYRAVRADPRLAEIRQKRDEIMAKAKETSDPEAQKQLWKEFRASMKDLTPEQRKALAADASKRRDQEEQRYYTLTDEQKMEWLDAQIDRMEEMKTRWENSSGQGNGGGGGQQRPGGFGGRGKESFAKMSSEEKENRRKQALDNSTPDQRARRDQIRKDLNARRELRGLAPLKRSFGR